MPTRQFFDELDSFMEGSGFGKATRHQLFEYNEPHYEVYFDGMSNADGSWRMHFTMRVYAGYASSPASDENLADWSSVAFLAVTEKNRWLVTGLMVPEPETRSALEAGATVFNRTFMMADIKLERTLGPGELDG